MIIVNLKPATHFKQVVKGATKDFENGGILRKHLCGTFHR